MCTIKNEYKGKIRYGYKVVLKNKETGKYISYFAQTPIKTGKVISLPFDKLPGRHLIQHNSLMAGNVACFKYKKDAIGWYIDSIKIIK